MKTVFYKMIAPVKAWLNWTFIAVALLAATVPHAKLRAEEVSEPKQLRILAVGMGASRAATYFLPEIAASVPGCEVVVDHASRGESTFERHLLLVEATDKNPDHKGYGEGITLKSLLTGGDYDIVTVEQEYQSSWRAGTFDPHGRELIAYIQEHAPLAEIMIHQTWAFHPYHFRLQNWGITYEEMHTQLSENYAGLAQSGGFDIIPSGDAFHLSWRRKPDPQYGPWDHDGLYQASQDGRYLLGLVWFGKLFDISPEKVSFAPKFIDEDKADFFRRVAADTLMLKEGVSSLKLD